MSERVNCMICGRDASVFWWPMDLWGNKGMMCDKCLLSFINWKHEQYAERLKE